MSLRTIDVKQGCNARVPIRRSARNHYRAVLAMIPRRAHWQAWKGTSGPSGLTGLDPYAFEYRNFVTTSCSFGRWRTTLRWRHLPSIESLSSRAPGSTLRLTGSYDMFDFAGRFELQKRINLRFGGDNVFDRKPERTF